MSDGHLTCPNCGADIEISEALSVQIRQGLETEFQTKLKQSQAELQQAREQYEKELVQKLDVQAGKVRAEAEKAVRDKVALEVDDLNAQLAEQRAAVEKGRAEELALRKKARELEAAGKAQELELQRKLDEERASLQEAARRAFEEEHHIKDLEQKKKIEDLGKALEDARRKAEQSSMERQGEVLEIDLEQSLRVAFPIDIFEAVPKGVKGADLIQRVRNEVSRESGVILWEIKNTKKWADAWISKLKDDQVEVRASLSVLVSRAMPDDIEQFGFRDGIWVCEPSYVLALASVLRRNLMDLTFVRLSSVGKNEKMEALYQYLSGTEFRQKMETIVETFATMHAQLQREKRAMEKNWKEREKQIQRVLQNTAGMYGDFRGLIGATLPEIEQLELSSGDDQPLLPEA